MGKGRRAQADAAERAAWADAEAQERAAIHAMTYGNLANGTAAYFEVCQSRRALDLTRDTPHDHPLAGTGEQGFRRAGRLKLRHDAEQLEHFVAKGLLQPKPLGRLASIYRQLIPRLPPDMPAV